MLSVILANCQSLIDMLSVVMPSVIIMTVGVALGLPPIMALLSLEHKYMYGKVSKALT
jgi:hypothetical protein